MSGLTKENALAAALAQAQEATPARRRLELLFDPDSFVEMDTLAGVKGQPCGVVTGYGTIMGGPAYAFAQDSTQTGGAVGRIHGRRIARIYEVALKTGAPVIGIFDSKGLRLDEGVEALDAYGEMLHLASTLSGVVPQLSLVLGTCGGTSALVAANADFVVMSKDAEFFLTPPAIAQSAGMGAPEAGSAAAAAKAGLAHLVCEDEQAAIENARRLVCTLPLNNLAAPAVFESTAAGDSAGLADPANAAALVESLTDAGSALELMADFGSGAYTAMAAVGGLSCGFVATKGAALTSDDCAKMAKLVSVCDAFQVPVITLVNTPGFAPSSVAELAGSVRDMARLGHIYAEATTAKIAVITGAAYGAAYITLASHAANADYTAAWPGASISALPPSAAVALLHGDRITAEKSRQQVEEEYLANEASPLNAAAQCFIDSVLAPEATRDYLISTLEVLSSKRVHTLPKKHSNLPL